METRGAALSRQREDPHNVGGFVALQRSSCGPRVGRPFGIPDFLLSAAYYALPSLASH